MLNNAKSVTSMAANTQLPFGTLRSAKSHPLRVSFSTADILTISDNSTLNIYLSGLFEQSGWIIVRRRTCAAGVSFLRDNRTALAVCDESLPDGFWHDAAMMLSSLPDAPGLIVIGDDEALRMRFRVCADSARWFSRYANRTSCGRSRAPGTPG